MTYEINYYVEYIESGFECCDIWSEETLNIELQKGEVKITFVTLSVGTRRKLNLPEEI